MENILDFLARAHRPFIHARGRAGTALLLEKLSVLPHQRVLEIGFGTGQTLVEMAVRWPETELYGLEKSPLMRTAAQRRLRFCGIDNVKLAPAPPYGRLPFPDDYFDAVYAESVLAIQPDEHLEFIFAEIFRVLRPGGVFLNNESLWLEQVPGEKIREINTLCRAAFGIPQAPEKWRYPVDWHQLAKQSGFLEHPMIRMHGLPIDHSFRWKIPLLRSALFSGWGKFRSRLSSSGRGRKRAFDRAMQGFSGYGNYLEGVLFHFSKPEE